MSESDADAEHQVLWILEIAETVAHIEVDVARQERLQGERLVETVVAHRIDDLISDAGIDREDRHCQFGMC